MYCTVHTVCGKTLVVQRSTGATHADGDRGRSEAREDEQVPMVAIVF